MAVQLTTGSAQSPGAARSGSRTEPGRGETTRIAIVEDELMVAWALESMAEELGHAVAGIFATGEAALAALADDPPDLVFMDINLGGGIDGIETAARLQSGRPVAILFVSAYADPATRERALAAVPGAILLGKPVLSATLGEAIAQLTVRRD